MNTTNQLGVFAVVLMILTGCTKETQTTVVGTTDKGATTQTTSKPSAPIYMSYKVMTESPAPGEEILIAVDFSSSIKSEVSAEMASAKKLTWVSNQTKWRFSPSKSEDLNDQTKFRVVAPEDGVYYINFVASVEQDGKVQRKPFTIPVNVGNGKVNLQSAGEVIIDDKGQKVIVQEVDSNDN